MLFFIKHCKRNKYYSFVETRFIASPHWNVNHNFPVFCEILNFRRDESRLYKVIVVAKSFIIIMIRSLIILLKKSFHFVFVFLFCIVKYVYFWSMKTSGTSIERS